MSLLASGYLLRVACCAVLVVCCCSLRGCCRLVVVVDCCSLLFGVVLFDVCCFGVSVLAARCVLLVVCLVVA